MAATADLRVVPPPRLEHYVMTEKLGQGTYATVYKAFKKVKVFKFSGFLKHLLTGETEVPWDLALSGFPFCISSFLTETRFNLTANPYFLFTR